MHEITPPSAWDFKKNESAKINFHKVPINSFFQALKVPLSNSPAFQQTAPFPFISHEFAGMKSGWLVSSSPDIPLCPSWNGFIEKKNQTWWLCYFDFISSLLQWHSFPLNDFCNASWTRYEHWSSFYCVDLILCRNFYMTVWNSKAHVKIIRIGQLDQKTWDCIRLISKQIMQIRVVTYFS